jgi:6-phosphogluconate dehydrogenase
LLNSYLVEITSKIFHQEDPQTAKRLIDVILDEAKQKGTGMWMSQDAMELQTPAPTVDMAVAMRHMSALKEERETASHWLEGPRPQLAVDRDALVAQLGEATYAALIITFAQGMAQLHRASQQHDYGLNLGDVARIWRGGCIIRAALLDEICGAFQDRPELPNLLLDDRFGGAVTKRQRALRAVVRAAAEAGIPAGGFMTALAYFDAYRSAWLPANLTQAQRDFFGSHTYERIDAKGKFHTRWSEGDDAPDSRRAPLTAEGAR